MEDPNFSVAGEDKFIPEMNVLLFEYSALAGALCFSACLQLAEDRMHGRSGGAITFKMLHNGSYGMSVVILNKIRETAPVPLVMTMRQTHQKMVAEK